MKIFYMYCDDPQLYDRDIEIATTALNKAVENMINRFPTEYMWGYKRFKGGIDVQFYSK